MHRSLFSWASALAVGSLVTTSTAGVAGISPREADDGLEKRLLCVGDSFNEVFQSVGMGSANNGVQADITAFCRSWIDIPGTTSYVQTVTPTLYVGRSLSVARPGHGLTSISSTSFPATETVEITTQQVLSATSTVYETTYRTEYALRKRNAVKKDQIHGREAAPHVTPRAILPKRMELEARVAASSSTRTLDVSSLGSALSSACSCKMIPGLTSFETFTASTVVRFCPHLGR